MEVLLIYWFDIVRSINYSQKVGNKQPVLLINQEALFYFFHLYPDALPSPNLLLLRLHRHKSLFAVVSFIVVMYRLNTERTCLPSIPDSGSVKDESLLQAIFHNFAPDVNSRIKWSLFPAQRAAAHIAAAFIFIWQSWKDKEYRCKISASGEMSRREAGCCWNICL